MEMHARSLGRKMPKRCLGTSLNDDEQRVGRKRTHQSACRKDRMKRQRSPTSSSSDFCGTSSNTSSTSSSSSSSSSGHHKSHSRSRKSKIKTRITKTSQLRNIECEKKRNLLKGKRGDSSSKSTNDEIEEHDSLDIPMALMSKSKSMAPMTQKEWAKQQSVVRKVYDESTGRHRLIKGDGEVIEEIVSRDRHRAINQQATKVDGEFFQLKVMPKK